MGPCCEDKQTSCWAWAMDEQCDENPGFMRSTCPRSCSLCSDQQAAYKISPYLPVSPHISLYLPISPSISLCSDQQAATTPSATERGPRTDPRQVRA